MSDEREATPDALLREYVMNPNTAKNEYEWWAHHEIKRLRRTTSILPMLDCRYTASGFSDIAGIHCPIKDPCERCKRELELAAERQRSWLPDNLMEELREFREGDSAYHYNLLRDILAAVEGKE